MDFPKARAELGVMSKMLDILEPLEDDVARLRVLCAVAIMHGHYEMALDILHDLMRRATEPEPPGPVKVGIGD